jgi:purine-binding chemotaxis protein CheW
MEQTVNQPQTPTDAAGNLRKTNAVQLIVFRLGNEEYGLTIDQIKEIVIMPNVARIPLTPPYVKGVANVRGNILAIVDLAEKFGLSPEAGSEAEGKPRYILVLESDKLKVGVMVKEVPSTLTVTQEDIDFSPSIIYDNSTEGNYIKGIVRLSGRMIILMDVFKAIARDAILQAINS